MYVLSSRMDLQATEEPEVTLAAAAGAGAAATACLQHVDCRGAWHPHRPYRPSELCQVAASIRWAPGLYCAIQCAVCFHAACLDSTPTEPGHEPCIKHYYLQRRSSDGNACRTSAPTASVAELACKTGCACSLLQAYLPGLHPACVSCCPQCARLACLCCCLVQLIAALGCGRGMARPTAHHGSAWQSSRCGSILLAGGITAARIHGCACHLV
jgi:hypothetical protein